MRRAGIKDVAALAGVSIKTVSRVTNGEAFVHPDTREKVLAAVSELSYVPNTAARSLKSGRVDTIAIIIDSLSDPFFAALVSAIETRAVSEGLSTLVASTGVSEDREREQIRSLVLGHQVAGIVLAPVAESHPYLTPFQASIPIIAVDRPRAYLDSIVVDDRGATRDAVRQLIEHGHHRIGFFDYDGRFLTVDRRLEGYKEALTEAGIAIDTNLIAVTDPDTPDYPLAAAGLFALADPPTALFASTSRSGIGLTRILHQSGRQNIAMISFGDFTLADTLSPAVSYIDQDPFRIGNAAIELLLEIRADPTPDRQERVVPTALIPRGSGEIAPSTPSEGKQ